MTDYKLAPNPDVKWGNPNRISPDGAEKVKSEFSSYVLANAKQTLEILRAKFHGGILDERIHADELRIEVEPELMPYVLEFLRDQADLEYRYLSQAAGAEWHKHLQTEARHLYVTYDVLSYKLRTRIFVYAVLPRVNPTMPSSAHVFPTADWHEREVYDLFGVIFEGHPNLQRILLPHNFDGHPLLKEYPARGKDVWELGKNVMPSGYDEILDDYGKGALSAGSK